MSEDDQLFRRPDDSPEVFVSHSSDDHKIVTHIVSALKRAGLTTYYSPEDARLGTYWDEVVNLNMRHCYQVVGVQSLNATRSRIVLAEWKRADKTGKLKFARIEKFDNPHDLPLEYDTGICARLEDWDGSPDHPECQKLINEVLEEVKRLREMAAVSAAAAAEASTKTENGKGAAAVPEPSRAPPARMRPGSINALVASPRADKQAEVAENELLAESPLPSLEKALEIGLQARDWSIANPPALVDKALKNAALQQILAAARSGQPDAQAIIGFAYELGAGGVQRNDQAAGRWLEKAAANGSLRAKAELAVLIASKRFGDSDVDRVDQLAAEAAAGDCARAKTLRALLRLTGTRMRSVSFETTGRLLEEASAAGDLLASGHYGWSLLQGRGVRRDVRRAHEVLRTAGQAGEPRAMAHLGVMYAFGRGVPRDLTKAAHWFGEAARRGDQWGEFYYGWANEMGVGIARDAVQARKWYGKAAMRGDADAQVRLARMLIEGQGGVTDYAQAARVLQEASDQGEDDATALLAQLHEEGRGVSKDLAKAIALYQQAADADQPNALWKLGMFYESGRGVERDRDHAIDLFRRAAFNAPDKRFFAMVMQRLNHHGAQLRRRKS